MYRRNCTDMKNARVSKYARFNMIMLPVSGTLADTHTHTHTIQSDIAIMIMHTKAGACRRNVWGARATKTRSHAAQQHTERERRRASAVQQGVRACVRACVCRLARFAFNYMNAHI